MCYGEGMNAGRRTWGWILGHAVSLVFYLYVFVLAPPLAGAMKEGLESPEPLWGVGLLLWAILLLEPVGAFWKVRFLRRRNQEEGFEPEGEMLGLGSVVVIGHMVVTVMVGMVALDCLGLVGEGANDNWAGAAILFLVCKDLFAFFATGGTGVARELPGHWKEGLADFLLLAFGCVAYSVWWQVFFDLGDLASQTAGMKVALAVLLGGTFALFYLPMRLPFVLEECYRQRARGRRWRVWTELAAGALLGFYPALLR